MIESRYTLKATSGLMNSSSLKADHAVTMGGPVIADISLVNVAKI